MSGELKNMFIMLVLFSMVAIGMTTFFDDIMGEYSVAVPAELTRIGEYSENVVQHGVISNITEIKQTAEQGTSGTAPEEFNIITGSYYFIYSIGSTLWLIFNALTLFTGLTAELAAALPGFPSWAALGFVGIVSIIILFRIIGVFMKKDV